MTQFQPAARNVPLESTQTPTNVSAAGQDPLANTSFSAATRNEFDPRSAIGVRAIDAANNRDTGTAMSSAAEANNQILQKGFEMAALHGALNSAQLTFSQRAYQRGKEFLGAIVSAGPVAATVFMGIGASLFEQEENRSQTDAANVRTAQPTGAVPDGSARAAGQSPGPSTGAGGNFLEKVKSGWKSLGTALGGEVEWAVATSMDAASMNNQIETAQAQIATQVGQTLNSVGSFDARLSGQRFGMQAQRMTAASQFVGATERWDEVNDQNMKFAGALGVLNMPISPYSPGNLPDNFDAASFAGVTGSKARAAAHFFDEGGRFHQYTHGVDGAGGIVNQMREAANSLLNLDDVGNTFGTTFGHAAKGLRRLSSDGFVAPNIIPTQPGGKTLADVAETLARYAGTDISNPNTGFSRLHAVIRPLALTGTAPFEEDFTGTK